MTTKLIEGVEGQPVARLHLTKDAGGYEFWQATTADHAICLKACEQRLKGFAMRPRAGVEHAEDSEPPHELHFEGKLVRPFG